MANHLNRARITRIRRMSDDELAGPWPQNYDDAVARYGAEAVDAVGFAWLADASRQEWERRHGTALTGAQREQWRAWTAKETAAIGSRDLVTLQDAGQSHIHLANAMIARGEGEIGGLIIVLCSLEQERIDALTGGPFVELGSHQPDMSAV